MAMSDPAALMPLAESIADGSPIDWPAVEGRATPDDQGIIRQLRVLSNLAVLHRSLPAITHDATGSAVGRRSHPSPAIGNWAHMALIARLGSGAFGEVYRAWDRRLEREVALKLLRVTNRADAIDDPQTSRIATEGRLLARVRHPNVITVHGVEIHEGRVGLCMDLIRGTTLEESLNRRGPFSGREAALIGIDLCRALASIHAAGLIHRDVKAQNVMREDGGRIVLMDLGTGREIDRAGRRAISDLAGTPLYLAPEIFDGAPASETTDLYSLGMLLYHLVTGTFPVRATNVNELREGQASGAAIHLRDARPDLPTAFVRVVDRAISQDPTRRYATAGALEADLVQALETGTAPHATVPESAPSWTPGRAVSWQAGVISLVLAAAVVFAVIGTFKPKPTPPRTALVDGKVRLAVLPPQDLTGQHLTHWPQLIQTLFVSEVAGVQDVAVMDPFSMNAMIENALGAAPPQRNARLLQVIRQSNVSLVIDGTILAAGAGGYEIQLSLVDPVTGEARFPARTQVKNEEQLADAVRSLASGVLGFLQLQVLQLANDKDLRPWISLRRQNIQAVNAFIQASQHIFRFERVAAERNLLRAIELDPTFIEPRVWVIPGLITQNKTAEAQRQYDALLELEAGASPFEQAMIGYVGARLRGDIPAQARQLEVALDYLPGNNVLLANLAGARVRLGDCAGAVNALRPAVEMRWQMPAIYEEWGSCSIQTDRLDDARRVMIDATSRPPVHPNVYALLEALAVADKDAGAEARYSSLFAARTRELDRPASGEPYLVKAYGKLASDCLSRGQYECAAKLFAKAAASTPAVEYYDGLGRTFEKMGDLAQAELQYRKALAIDPTWSHASERLRELKSERR